MSEIKFRGKDKAGTWHYGSLVILTDGRGEKWYYIVNGNLPHWVLVIPESVGQFTGLYAQYDETKPIYEGDILKSHEHIDIVIWREDLCGFSYENEKSRMNLVDWLENAQYSNTEIIGNKTDNPELYIVRK